MGCIIKPYLSSESVGPFRVWAVVVAGAFLVDGNSIQLTDGTELQIGSLYRDELEKFISVLR